MLPVCFPHSPLFFPFLLPFIHLQLNILREKESFMYLKLRLNEWTFRFFVKIPSVSLSCCSLPRCFMYSTGCLKVVSWTIAKVCVLSSRSLLLVCVNSVSTFWIPLLWFSSIISHWERQRRHGARGVRMLNNQKTSVHKSSDLTRLPAPSQWRRLCWRGRLFSSCEYVLRRCDLPSGGHRTLGMLRTDDIGMIITFLSRSTFELSEVTSWENVQQLSSEKSLLLLPITLPVAMESDRFVVVILIVRNVNQSRKNPSSFTWNGTEDRRENMPNELDSDFHLLLSFFPRW